MIILFGRSGRGGQKQGNVGGRKKSDGLLERQIGLVAGGSDTETGSV